MDIACISVQDTGKELYRGAHSRIVEVLYGGVRCKAKRIETSAAGVEELRKKIDSACVLLARLRHPHVVQFLGTRITPDGGSVAIVTEYLPCSLASVLGRYGSLPEPLTHSILRDSSTALAYLHDLSPPVAHGYLVPANVLLTDDFTAKLSDVGVSRNVDLLRDLPLESAVYLPPPSECPGTEGDVYSLGAIMVHAIGGTHPASLTSLDDKSLLNSLGVAERHPLCGLMRGCLNSDPTKRPNASQVLNSISLEVTKFPPMSMESRLAHIQVMKGGGSSSPNHPLAITRRAFSPKRLLRGLEDDRTMALVIESESLKLEVEELRVSNRGLRTSLERQMKFVSARDHEMAAKLMAKDQEIMAKQQEVNAQGALLKAAEDNLAAKEATNRGLNLQLRSLQDYLVSRAEVRIEPHSYLLHGI